MSSTIYTKLDAITLDTQEAIAQLITQGKNPMPAYNDRLTVPEIEAVAAYVLEQAEIGWK